jgi:hypothetical protein
MSLVRRFCDKCQLIVPPGITSCKLLIPFNRLKEDRICPINFLKDITTFLVFENFLSVDVPPALWQESEL